MFSGSGKAVGVLALVVFAILDGSGAVLPVHPGQSIQDAVNAAAQTDTVLIYDGDYFETVMVFGKALTIGSLFLITGDTVHTQFTVIHADTSRPDSQSCFIIADGESLRVRLSGLTLTEGRGTLLAPPQPVVPAGGGVHVNATDLMLDHCTIRNCSAAIGGGVCDGSHPDYFYHWIALRDCIFYRCAASDYGGGGRVGNSRISNCSFIEDSAITYGGGANLSSGLAYVDSSTFTRCYAVDGGGMNYAACTGRIADCVFQDNRGPGIPYTALATDLDYSSSAPVTRCIFRGTVSEASNIFLEEHNSCSPFLVHFTGNLVEADSITVTNGVLIAQGGYGEIAYNIFRNNRPHAGCIYTVQRSHMRIHHNSFAGNVQADALYASAIAISYDSYPTIDSNIIAGNRGNTVSYPEPAWAEFQLQNNWWGDATGPYHPWLNPGGRGDTILQDHITFSPWLSSQPDTTMPPSAAPERPKIARPVSTWELMAVYPNPFNSEIRIVIAGFTGRDFRLTLHNLLGQEVAVIHSGPITGGELRFAAPSFLANGVYFVRAADNHRVDTRKIIFLK